jgi:DNA-binding LacI/PurR family transcriptional regulator
MTNVTLKNVAKHAKCSMMTVSNVLNKNAKVSPKMTEKVMKAVYELGYKPNLAAKKLAGRRGSSNAKLHRFGCIIPNTENNFNDPYYGEILDIIKKELRQLNYDLAFIENESEFDDELRRIELLDEINIDGLIVLDCTQQLLDTVKKHTKNVVKVGVCMSSPNIDYIGCDMVQVGRMAVEYLTGLGHRNIAYFGFKLDDCFVGVEREGGYRLAMMLQKEVLPAKSYYTPEPFSIQSFYDSAVKMLTENPDLTAVFCHSDTLASILIKAAWNLNIKVPEDLSIVGFNDDAIAQLCNPALTTIRANKKDIGHVAAQCAVERMNNPKLPLRSVLLPCELIERESSALCSKTLTQKEA